MSNEGSTNPFAPPPGHEPVELMRVGFGQRLVAWIIDLLGLIVLISLLSLIFAQFSVPMTESLRQSMESIKDIYSVMGVPSSMTELVTEIMPPIAMGSVIGAIAYSLIEGLGGASPGKLTMGYKIANQDASAGDTQLFLRRWAIKNLGAILTFIAFVPSLGFMETIGSIANIVIFFGCFAVLGQARLALHDRIAQTAVYHKDDIRS